VFERLCFEASKLYEGDLCEWFHLTNQLLLEVKERIKEGYTKLEMTVKPLEEVVDKKYKDFVGSSKKSFISHPEPILYGGSCPKSIFKANIVFSYVKSSSSQELNAEYEGKPLFVNSELAEEIISNNNIRKLEEKFYDLCRKAKSEESDNNYVQAISLYSQAIDLVGIWSFSAGALFCRARLFRKINQFDNAIKDYDQFSKSFFSKLMIPLLIYPLKSSGLYFIN
jgi:tetratricopeptide (TPR) repeat protein